MTQVLSMSAFERGNTVTALSAATAALCFRVPVSITVETALREDKYTYRLNLISFGREE